MSAGANVEMDAGKLLERVDSSINDASYGYPELNYLTDVQKEFRRVLAGIAGGQITGDKVTVFSKDVMDESGARTSKDFSVDFSNDGERIFFINVVEQLLDLKQKRRIDRVEPFTSWLVNTKP